LHLHWVGPVHVICRVVKYVVDDLSDSNEFLQVLIIRLGDPKLIKPSFLIRSERSLQQLRHNTLHLCLRLLINNFNRLLWQSLVRCLVVLNHDLDDVVHLDMHTVLNNCSQQLNCMVVILLLLRHQLDCFLHLKLFQESKQKERHLNFTLDELATCKGLLRT
jgi:hypothetical protein